MSSSEQVWLNSSDNAAIRAGLNRILNGLAEIKYGLRYAPEILYPGVVHRFRARKVDDEMTELILRLRNRLQARSTRVREKFRLNCFELAAVAFALRVAPEDKQPEDARQLASKLERYRRRARRSFERNHGPEQYRSMQSRWKGFTQWVRYNVIPLRIPKRNRGLRAYHKEQFESLVNIARTLIEETCTAPVADSVLIRLMKLAKRHVRRGRYSCNLRELLSRPEEAKKFVFEFLRKRLELTLKFEYLTRVEQWTVRGEKFKAHLEVPQPPSPVSLIPISDEKVKGWIAGFLIQEVEPRLWANVIEQVTFLVSHAHPAKPVPVQAESFEELVQISKPQMEVTDAIDKINYASDWLINALVRMNASPIQAINLAQGGYAAALAH